MALMVQGAADWELEALLDAVEDAEKIRKGIWSFWRGRIGSTAVVIARTDWGPINAVAATTTGIEAFQPTAILSQGMAGAHDPGLSVGDIVVGERTVDHSGYKSDRAGIGEGIQLSRWSPLSHRFRLDGEALIEFPGFPGDSRLVQAAMSGRNPYGRLIQGTIGSAYQYNRELDYLRDIRLRFGTDCEDMESAYSAGAAAALGVPFVSIRMISNSEWNEATLDRNAGRRCGAFVLDLIRRNLIGR